MISSAKKDTNPSSSPPAVVVDLQPSRPSYRGFTGGSPPQPISMQADPSFSSITSSGGFVSTHSEPHTVLDNFFLVSGYIPRVTPYETGVKNGIRFDSKSDGGAGTWEKDEEIADERFLMCNLKGKGIVLLTGCSHGGVVNAALHSVYLLENQVPLYAILGGYHLVGEQEANAKETVRDLKKLDLVPPVHLYEILPNLDLRLANFDLPLANRRLFPNCRSHWAILKYFVIVAKDRI